MSGQWRLGNSVLEGQQKGKNSSCYPGLNLSISDLLFSSSQWAVKPDVKSKDVSAGNSSSSLAVATLGVCGICLANTSSGEI